MTIISLEQLSSDFPVFVDGDWVESKDQDPDGNVRLIQLADIGVGLFRDRSNRYMTKTKADELRCTFLSAGDVLVARMPDPIGRSCIFPEMKQDCVTVVDVCVLRPDSTVDNRWLMWMLNAPQFRFQVGQFVTGTTRKRISRGNLKKLKLPEVPIAEQKRIAAILDKADAIRQKRKEAIKLTEELLRSTFLEMFGPNNPNYMNWKPEKIESLVSDRKRSIRSGPFGSALRHSEFVSEGIAVLGIDNAVKNKFSWGKRRFITKEKYEKLRRYKVYPRDVLVTIMGTVGRSAIVPEEIPEAITTKHLAVLTCDEEKVTPQYIALAFQYDPLLLKQVSAKNRGAIMDGLNLGIIREIVLRVPGPHTQKKFLDFVRTFDVDKINQELAFVQSKNIFQSLVQKAFKGEL